ncbi:MAG: GH92 family glycosyl hydrolase [Candidatus Thermoplasmatota archaeon]|nr:GH92 family glycosyl hydrolase [Candidatus Thermoplasmatota archaeon]
MTGNAKTKTALALVAVFITLAASFSGCISWNGQKTNAENSLFEPTDYVNPFIGTGGHGHTFPGPCAPFGMVQLSPDTGTVGWDWCSGYHSSDNSIIGFSHTHLSGTGCGDYGDILLMPANGELKVVPGDKATPGSGYRSVFSHDTEKAEAGYYSVLLQDYNITAELTTTTRVGIHKYTFNEGGEGRVLIDLSHGITQFLVDQVAAIAPLITTADVKIVGDNVIEGFRSASCWSPRHTVYFYAEFSKPFKSSGTWNEGMVRDGSSEDFGRSIGAFANFDVTPGESIMVKVGISFVSVEGARANLEAEAPGWDFDALRQSARNEWNGQLGKVEVFGGTDDQKRTFYTAMYHSMIHPSTFSDVDGSYMGVDWQVHHTDSTQYTVFSLWDTFRALNPLIALLNPGKAGDMVNSMVNIYKDGGGLATGWLPRWHLANSENNAMTGTHADSVIADAYVKGIVNFDIATAYEAIWKDGMMRGTYAVPETGYASFGEGRYGIEYYMTIGYVPADINSEFTDPYYPLCLVLNQGVSRTVEYAYDDFCIAQMAKGFGKTSDYDTFMARSKNYANLFDAGTGFMRGKSITGQWMNPSDFDPMKIYPYYTEGNAWQWSWFAPQDVSGLIQLFGGKDKFIEKLDALFTQVPKDQEGQPDVSGLIGQYAHGNEPVHHVAYLYDFAGAPWKTQEMARRIMADFYNSTREGLCGNDDCGQMSAWYVFSAMGFYPLCPGLPQYAIGSPIFDKVVIHLDNGSDFVIEAKNNSPDNKYIQSATLNGEPLGVPQFDHKDILCGGAVTFEMGSNPSSWGKEFEQGWN